MQGSMAGSATLENYHRACSLERALPNIFYLLIGRATGILDGISLALKTLLITYRTLLTNFEHSFPS